MDRFKVLAVLLCFSSFSFSQSLFENSWSYSLYLGASNMLGGLGGANQIGTNGLKDLNFRATRLA